VRQLATRPRGSWRSAQSWIGLASLLCLLPVAPLSAQQGKLRGLDAYIEQAMKQWEVPGLALAVVKDDSVIYAKGYGVRELGRPEPVTPHTLFAIGSTTKAFTSALMGMLVDEKKVSFDDPVTKYLPWFQMYDPYVTREMTLRDLMTHRSGLSRGDLLWYGTTRTRDEVVHQIRYLAPSWSFRSHFGYQNIMFLTAGQVEAAVSGESWDALVHQRILDPLGMTSTVTSVKDLPAGGDVATPHARIDQHVVPIHWRNIDDIGPAGSINSNVLDMARWVRMQLDTGVYQGHALVSARSLAVMHSPQMVVPLDERTQKLHPTEHFSMYGLGWFLLDYRGHEMVHHGGNIDGFSAEVALLPEEHLGVVILTNMNGTALRDALPFRIFDMFLGPPLTDWSSKYFDAWKLQQAKADSTRAAVEAARVPDTHPSLQLARYAGTYRDTLYGDVTVRLENGHLVLQSDTSSADLEHWNYDTFRAVWRDPMRGKQFATFELDARANPSRLKLEDLATFLRVPDEPAGGRR
jgi:CubicO group peptidase (beta-lactamase class C family)